MILGLCKTAGSYRGHAFARRNLLHKLLHTLRSTEYGLTNRTLLNNISISRVQKPRADMLVRGAAQKRGPAYGTHERKQTLRE